MVPEASVLALLLFRVVVLVVAAATSVEVPSELVVMGPAVLSSEVVVEVPGAKLVTLVSTDEAELKLAGV